MKVIAEYVMRGRPQAMTVAVSAAILPLMQWLGNACVALVMLRKGPIEGMIVGAWAALPTVVLFYLSKNPSSLIALVGTLILAYVLRVTLSWEITLLVAVVIGIVGGVVLELVASDILRQFTGVYMEMMAQSGIGEEETFHLLVSIFALGQTFAMVAFLALGRWWQSALYNPGGFGSEFQGLRLSTGASSVLVLLIVAAFLTGQIEVTRYMPLLTVPLVISAIGLCHWFMEKKALSGGWVFTFYVTLIFLFQLVYPLLAALALLDSWSNLRKRSGLTPPE